MSSAQVLIQRLQAQRASWCELQPATEGKPAIAVQLSRPVDAELPGFQAARQAGTLRERLVQAACEQATGWRGMSEAALFGAAIGSADELPFDLALWAEIVRDRQPWLDAVAVHLMDAISAHIAARSAAAKN